MIRKSIALYRRQHAERDADDQTEQHGCQRQFQCGRNMIAQIVQHRTLIAQGHAQIAAQQVSHIFEILLVQRAIQSVLYPDAFNGFLAGLFPCHHGGGISGNGVRKQKDAQRYSEQYRNHSQNASDDERTEGHGKPSG